MQEGQEPMKGTFQVWWAALLLGTAWESLKRYFGGAVQLVPIRIELVSFPGLSRKTRRVSSHIEVISRTFDLCIFFSPSVKDSHVASLNRGYERRWSRQLQWRSILPSKCQDIGDFRGPECWRVARESWQFYKKRKGKRSKRPIPFLTGELEVSGPNLDDPKWGFFFSIILYRRLYWTTNCPSGWLQVWGHTRATNSPITALPTVSQSTFYISRLHRWLIISVYVSTQA